jgi:hypothetical protein
MTPSNWPQLDDAISVDPQLTGASHLSAESNPAPTWRTGRRSAWRWIMVTGSLNLKTPPQPGSSGASIGLSTNETFRSAFRQRSSKWCPRCSRRVRQLRLAMDFEQKATRRMKQTRGLRSLRLLLCSSKQQHENKS